jgi:hypothetical protein
VARPGHFNSEILTPARMLTHGGSKLSRDHQGAGRRETRC